MSKIQGFFSNQQLQTTTSSGGRFYTCISCGLYKNSITPKMEPQGAFKKRILIIGPSPDKVDDKRNEYWRGSGGRLLRKTLEKHGIDLYEDCACLNAVSCLSLSPKLNIQKPTSHEMVCCRNIKVLPIIEKLKPHIILLMGDVALESVIGNRWKTDLGSLFRWRGWHIPDRVHKAWICPMDSPQYIEALDKPEAYTIWEQDLERALALVDVPFPDQPDEREKVRIIESVKDLPFMDMRSLTSRLLAVDLETTSMKPHAPGCDIVSGALYDGDLAYSFLWPTSPEELNILMRILCGNRFVFIAHNMKFENNWIWEKLGHPIKNWGWDSMIGTHVLDNRAYITGLKFQTYVQFGEVGYNDAVEDYLKGVDKKDGNSLNRIHELLATEQGTHDVLLYNGLDTIFNYDLAMKQMNELGITLHYKDFI